MVFSNPEFIFVLLPLIIVALALARRSGSAAAVSGTLLIASLALYLYSEPRFFAPFVLLIAANHFVAKRLTGSPSLKSKTWWVLGIFVNLAPIAWLKYACLLNGALSCSVWVPLGISFFSFQQITFLSDVRKGATAVPSFWRYALFIAFFPQLVAGPILRADEFLGQLRPSHLLREITRQQAAALTLFAIGLVKKVIFADRLGVYVEDGLVQISGGYQPTFLEAWALMPSAAAEIYFDYSAYGDFAMALGLMCGIAIPPSFLSPYKSLTLAEFWRRWNVTLMRFFRDHIYIPLGGNRYGPTRQRVAVLATMVACGLWHGAGLNFALWGLIVGGLIILERWFMPPIEGLAIGATQTFIRRTIVFLGYVVPLTIFLTPDLDDAKRIVAGLGGLGGWGWPTSLNAPITGLLEMVGVNVTLEHSALPLISIRQGVLCVAAWCVIYALPNTYALFRETMNTSEMASRGQIPTQTAMRWELTRNWALVTAILLVVGLTSYSPAGTRAFFYYRF